MVGQQNISAMDLSSPGSGAENFLKILGLIHRSILPRRIVLSNGAARLVLQVERARAVLDGASSDRGVEASAGIAAAMGQFCSAGQHMTHRVEQGSRMPVGFSSIAIVNAQRRDAPSNEGRHYHFADDGWPLTTPADASFTSLEAAARIAWAMLRWRNASGGLLQAPALIVAVSEDLPADVSVTVGEALAVTVTQPAQLGQIVSHWRNRVGDEGKSDQERG
jgi:hypothetical protein